jgi:hypothetical protein
MSLLYNPNFEKTIKNTLLLSQVDDNMSIDTIYQKYKTLLSLRHDLLHVICCEVLCLKADLGTSKPIINYYPKLIDVKLSNLSPDIVFEKDGEVFLIEVTVTHLTSEAEAYKISKYDGLKRHITKIYGKVVEIVPVVVHPNLTQALFIFESMSKAVGCQKIPDLLYKRYVEVHKLIQGKITVLRQYLPDELFTKMSESEDGGVFFEPFLSKVEYQMIQESNYKHYSLSKENNYMDLVDAEKIFENLYMDTEVKNLLADTKYDVSMFAEGFNKIDEIDIFNSKSTKPTLHIPFASKEFGLVPKFPFILDSREHKLNPDQQNVINILNFVTKNFDSNSGDVHFIRHLSKCLNDSLKSKGEMKIFETGFMTGSYDQDKESREQLKSKQFADRSTTKDSKIGFRGFLLSKGFDLRTELPYISRNKQLSITPYTPLTDSANFKIESGVKFLKHHPNGKKMPSQKHSCPKGHEDFDHFLGLLADPELSVEQIDSMFFLEPGEDTPSIKAIKSKSRKHFINFLSLLTQFKGYSLGYHTHLACSQLLHFCELNTKENNYCFINTGHPNVLHIAQGGTVDRGKDIGQPFFSIIVTTDERWANRVFGDYTLHSTMIDGQAVYLIVTKWRRLPSRKLAFIKDNFYSTLSTGFDTFSRCKSPREVEMKEYYKFIFGFRSVIGMCTSQRVAEMLLDVRYVVMSCYSEYSNIASLIVDKFKPHYPNLLSRWIVCQLRKKCPLISDCFKNNGFLLNRPVFFEDSRIAETLGGKIEMPSLWTNYFQTGIQDMFDEMFVYVHTIKEPSSVFHEEIKAINTIREFQSLYDKLSEKAQAGIHTQETFKSFLLSKQKVGCWRDFVFHSSKITSSKYKGLNHKQKLSRLTNHEPLSELESTKSSIPEYVEKTGSTEEDEKKRKRRKRVKKYLETGDIEILSEFDYHGKVLEGVHPESTVAHNSKSGRAKVHDLLYDFLLRNDDMQNVLQVAHWNMFMNNSRSVAHICIKAQYGAKREFYVVNAGAKCMLRIFENSFKYIGSLLDEEMISVPGDKKLTHMNELTNQVIRSSKSKKDTIMYTNGDCTKWSACETMASFLSLNDGWSEILGEGLTEYNKAVVSCWANKKIKIPQSLLEGTTFITEKTKYMQDGEYMLSTQNFLQGMFNYSSSVKAVCATNFSIYMWEKIYPNRIITIRHLEHSDDYALIIRVTNIQDFIDFRIMHKLSQKMHGINDSDKKTNTQKYILEFISLMLFNGHMAYPNIKKTKEVGLNLGCDGYQRDIMSAISRSGESVRMGVPSEVAYIQQLIQSVNIYRAYSLTKGMRNSMDYIDNPSNFPLELFGTPDCLPIAYNGTSGDPNNYRLFMYSKMAKRILEGLFYYTKEQTLRENQNDSEMIYPTFESLTYNLVNKGGRIKNIRDKIGCTPEEVDKYWEDHLSYLICKPNDPYNFREWLKYMYYNPSFILAYRKMSRQQMVLRLSHIVSSPCARLCNEIEYTTIKSAGSRLMELALGMSRSVPETEMRLMLTGGDTNIETFFEYTKNSAILRSSKQNIMPVVGAVPNSFNFLKLENNLAIVIQYTCNHNDYVKDRRHVQSGASIENDKQKLLTYFPGLINGDRSVIRAVFTLTKTQRNRQSVGLMYGASNGFNYLGYLKNNLEYGLSYKTTYSVISEKEITIHNPLTGANIFERDLNFTQSMSKIILENITELYYFLIIKMNVGISSFRDIINQSLVKDTNRSVMNELMSMSIENISYEGHSDFHVRMLCFLKSTLCFMDSDLNDYIKSKFSYRHKYDQQNRHYEWQKEPMESVFIEYLDTPSKACRYRNGIITFTKHAGLSVMLSLHSIGMKLLSQITQENLNRIMLYNYTKHIQIIDGTDLLNTLTVNGEVTDKYGRPFNFISVHGDVLKIVENISAGDKYLPIVITSNIRHDELGIPVFLDVPPVCDIKSGRVYIGNNKLFTLPLWACSSNRKIIVPNVKIGGRYHLSKLFDDQLTHNYLSGKHTISEIKLKSVIDPVSFPEIIQNKCFEYDFDIFNSVIDRSGIEAKPNTGFDFSTLSFEFSKKDCDNGTLGTIDESGQSGEIDMLNNMFDEEVCEVYSSGEIKGSKSANNMSDDESLKGIELDEIQEEGENLQGHLNGNDNMKMPPAQKTENVKLASIELTEEQLLSYEFNYDGLIIEEVDEFDDSQLEFAKRTFRTMEFNTNGQHPNKIINEIRDDLEPYRFEDANGMLDAQPFSGTSDSSEDTDDDTYFGNDEMSYTQIGRKKIPKGLDLTNHVLQLPSFDLYLKRIWAGYQCASELTSVKNIWNGIKLIAQVNRRKKISNLKLTKVEDEALEFINLEIENIMSEGTHSSSCQIDNDLYMRVENKYKVNIFKRHVLGTHSAAERMMDEFKIQNIKCTMRLEDESYVLEASVGPKNIARALSTRVEHFFRPNKNEFYNTVSGIIDSVNISIKKNMYD